MKWRCPPHPLLPLYWTPVPHPAWLDSLLEHLWEGIVHWYWSGGIKRSLLTTPCMISHEACLFIYLWGSGQTFLSISVCVYLFSTKVLKANNSWKISSYQATPLNTPTTSPGHNFSQKRGKLSVRWLGTIFIPVLQYYVTGNEAVTHFTSHRGNYSFWQFGPSLIYKQNIKNCWCSWWNGV